ncbi:serine hydrolase domain-containing protein [Acidobacteriota bacterium]
MKFRFRLNTFLLIFIFIFGFGFSVGFSDEKTNQVDALFAQWDKSDSPGCALAVFQNGKIIYNRGYGMANLELDIPISPQSVFYIGSVSKQFVSACIGLLALQGKLSLDDNIRKYVPEIPEYDSPITIRHLIYHTSGMRDYLTLLGIAGIDFGTYHEQDILDLLARQKELNFSPGEEHLYSNSGYFMLSVIVERASGKTLREFADEFIFKPLGMNHSHFHDDYTQLIKNRAMGYFPAGKGQFRNFISTFDNVGSGGLFTSIEDLFLWDQNFYSYKVGGQKLNGLMHTKGQLNNGVELDYAFALDIGSYKGLKVIEHGGALGGYRSALTRFPEQNFSVAILSNLSSVNPSSLAYRVADIYLADYYQEERTEIGTEQLTAIELPEKILKEKEGYFINPDSGAYYRIRLVKGQLQFSGMGQSLTLGAISEDEFFVTGISQVIILKFKKDEGGQALTLEISQEDSPLLRYKSFEPLRPSTEEFKEYIGEYSSDELDTTFKIELIKNRLRFTHRNAPQGTLQTNYKDIFRIGNLRLMFSRDESGQIDSITVNAGRVTNLRFYKK